MLDIESVRNDNCGLRKLDLSAYMNKQIKDLVAYLTSFKDGDFLIQTPLSRDTMYRIEAGNIVEADHEWDDYVIKDCDVFIKKSEPVRISISTTYWKVAVREIASAVEVLAYYLAKKGASVESPLYLGSNAAELATELYKLGFTSVDDHVVQLVGELWASNFGTYTSLINNATNILKIAQEEISAQVSIDHQYTVVTATLYIAGKLCAKEIGKGSNSIAHDAIELAIELYKCGYEDVKDPIVLIAAEMYTGTLAELTVKNAISSYGDVRKAASFSKIKETLGFKRRKVTC